MRLVVALVALSGFLVAADKKPDQNNGKALIAEGEALEKQGKLLEAKSKFSEALPDSKDASKHLREIEKKIAAESTRLIGAAKMDFADKRYDQTIEKLKQAGSLSPDDPKVSCNIGVAYHLNHNDSDALTNLRLCISQTKAKEEKARFEQLITQIETGETITKFEDAQKAVLADLNRTLDDGTQVLATTNQENEFCKKLGENETSLPKTPAILFNLAKCAEADGRLEDANKYFTAYLAAAPNSVAEPEAKDAVADLTAVLALTGPKADETRDHYRRASQFLRAGRYDRALKEYELVIDAAPDFAIGHRRLALFYESLGRTADARTQLEAYLSLPSVSEDERSWATKEASELDQKTTLYDENTKEAATKLRPLLFQERSDENGAQYDKIIETLHKATDAFPLGAKANNLLGYIYLESDYSVGAKQSFDAARSGGLPPFFLASVSDSQSPGKKTDFALIRVKEDGFQIEPFYSDDPTKRVRKGQESERRKDAACKSLMDDPETLFSTLDCGTAIPISQIKSIESKQYGLEITVNDKPMWIRPVNLFMVAPLESGPASRKFHNRYARVLQRYMAYDGTKLGVEGMSGGEKVRMGMMFASLAAGGAVSAIGAASAASAAVSTSMFAMVSLSMAQQYRGQVSMMSRTGIYKPIPYDPAPLTFRTEGN
jgi:tetratricopeptide (TPR) repeat protein